MRGIKRNLRTMALFIAVLALILSFSGCDKAVQLSETLTEVERLTAAGQAATERVQAIIDWKAENWEAEKERERLYKETGKEKYEPEDASEETMAKARELADIITEIDEMKTSSDALALGADDDENTAVYAVRAYANMLLSAANDLKSDERCRKAGRYGYTAATSCLIILQ